MNVAYPYLDKFLQSLRASKSFIQVDKFGLCDTTMNKSSFQPNEPLAFDILSLSFFTKGAKLILAKHFSYNNQSSSPPESSPLYLSLIENVLLQKDYSVSASQSPFYISNEEISFASFLISKVKYHILNITKSNIVIMSQFAHSTQSSVIKLFLFHLAVAFFNFIGSQSNFINTHNLSSINDAFNTKLFDVYILSPITKHFSLTTRTLFKKTGLHLVNIKYKTFYLVDLSSNEVVFSAHSTRKGFKRVKQIPLNPVLWNELMYHCNNLKVQYIKRYQSRFDSFEYQDYFVKMEYTSTYPRLTFIVKFLPVLKGMALIHLYSQNKLSRNEEGKVQYKEFDILYGNEMNKDSGNIEYRYKEPKKLKEVELFFIEFLLSCNSSFGFFFYPKFELKYLSTPLLKLIQDNIEGSSQTPCEKVLYKITNALYEEYLVEAKREQESFKRGDEEINNESSKKTEMITNYQWNCISKNEEGIALYQISKHFILDELFNGLTPELNPEEGTILFSRIGDQSALDNNEQHISELINNDMSTLTKQFTMKNNVDDMPHNDKSLFNMNITSIGTDVKENVRRHFKQSKSEIVPQTEKKQHRYNPSAISKEEVVLNILSKSRDEHSPRGDSDKSFGSFGNQPKPSSPHHKDK